MSARPVLDLPVTSRERILDIIAIGTGLTALLVAGIQYGNLPQQIPTHFNASGEADGFNSKAMLFVLPVLSLVLGTAMILLTRIPHQFNYLVKITEQNAEYEYRKARLMLRFVNVAIAILFLELTWETIHAAGSSNAQLSPLFWVVFISEMIVIPVMIFSLKPAKTAH